MAKALHYSDKPDKEGEESQEEGTTTESLASAGLKVNHLVETGDQTPEAVEAIGGSMPRPKDELAEDTIGFKMEFSYRVKEIKCTGNEAIFSSRERERLRKLELRWTRRSALSLLMGMFDPLQ